MGGGFSCDDGWFGLIDELCAKLQAAVAAGKILQPVTDQVKQKFGELRFYVSPQSLTTEALIAQARTRSAVTCEVCGAAGVLRWQRGVLTVCDLYAEPGSTIVPPRPDRP